MSRELHELAARLNRLIRRRLELEAEVRMVDLSTPLYRVRALKREHARVVGEIRLLERRVNR